MQYNSIARFAFGDLTEALLMLVMREAGIDIVDFQKEVALEIEGVVVKGTLDVIIRGDDGKERVWDIKSASDWAYKNKFTGEVATNTSKMMTRSGTSCKVTSTVPPRAWTSVAGLSSTSRAVRLPSLRRTTGQVMIVSRTFG